MSDGATSTNVVREYQSISPELQPYYTGFGEPGTPGFQPGLLGEAYKTYARPYSEAYAPYLQSPYAGGQRIVGPAETEAGQQFRAGIMGLTAPGAYGTAESFAGQAGAGLMGAMGTQPSTVAAPSLTQFQMAAPQTFGAEQAQQYMSPYMQNVVDVAKRKAMEDAQRGQLQANLAAGRKGSLGTSGQLLATTERERNLGTQLGDIQARGLQEAFAGAQSQFERDRAAQMLAQQRNLEAQLGVQQLGSTQTMTAQQLNQAANLEAARQRMAAAHGLGSLAATTGQIGALQNAAEMDRLKALGAYSELERGLEQQRRDIGYQDVMREVGYPEQRLFGMSSLLRGTPMGDRLGTASTTTPAPSIMSQLAGLGLSGLSLYNLMNR